MRVVKPWFCLRQLSELWVENRLVNTFPEICFHALGGHMADGRSGQATCLVALDPVWGVLTGVNYLRQER